MKLQTKETLDLFWHILGGLYARAKDQSKDVLELPTELADYWLENRDPSVRFAGSYWLHKVFPHDITHELATKLLQFAKDLWKNRGNPQMKSELRPSNEFLEFFGLGSLMIITEFTETETEPLLTLQSPLLKCKEKEFQPLAELKAQIYQQDAIDFSVKYYKANHVILELEQTNQRLSHEMEKLKQEKIEILKQHEGIKKKEQEVRKQNDELQKDIEVVQQEHEVLQLVVEDKEQEIKESRHQNEVLEAEKQEIKKRFKERFYRGATAVINNVRGLPWYVKVLLVFLGLVAAVVTIILATKEDTSPPTWGGYAGGLISALLLVLEVWRRNRA